MIDPKAGKPNTGSGLLFYLLAGLAGLLVAGTIGWALLHSGATSTSSLYRVGLAAAASSILLAVAWLLSPPEGVPWWRAPAIMAVGLGLLVAVAWLPMLRGAGFVHLAAGWTAFLATFTLTRGARLGIYRTCLILLAGLGAAEAFLGLARGRGGVSGVSISGTLLNRNHYAGLIALTLPLAIGVFYSAFGRAGRERWPASERLAVAWIAVLACASVAVAVPMSGSRGGTMALASSLVFLGAVVLTRRRSADGMRLGAVVVLVLALGGFGFMLGVEPLIARFGRFEDALVRLHVYRDSLRLIADNPILGVGPWMYRWSFHPYQTTQPGTLYSHAHNDYIETAAEWGVPLAIAFWSVVAIGLVRSVALFRSPAADPRLRGIGLGCATSIVAILVHSLVDFSLQIPGIWMVFGAVLGIAIGLPISNGTPPIAPLGGRLVSAAVLVAAILAGLRLYRQLEGVELATLGGDPDELERALAFDPTHSSLHYDLGVLYDRLDPPEPERALTHLERSVELNPYNYLFRYDLADAYEERGRGREAIAQLDEAVRLHPLSGNYRYRLAELEYRHGSREEALAEMGRAIELPGTKLIPSAVDLFLESSDWDAALSLVSDQAAVGISVLGTICNRIDATGPPPGPLLERWERLLASDPPSLEDGRFVATCLLTAGGASEARRAWTGLASAHGIVDPAWSRGEQLAWHGDFEGSWRDGPFDWSPASGETLVSAVRAGAGRNGSAALVVDLRAARDGDLRKVQQVLPLEPGQSYRLSLALRSADLPSQVAIVVTGQATGVLLELAMERGRGEEWQSVGGVFAVPSNERVVALGLRRLPAAATGSVLGTLRLDDVAVEPVLPRS